MLRTNDPRFWLPILIIALAAIDLATTRITVAVLYIIPLILYAFSNRRRALPWLCATMITLTFLCYKIKTRGVHSVEELEFRLFNRCLAAMSIALSSVALYWWVGFRTSLGSALDPEQDVPWYYNFQFHSLMQLVAGVAGACLMIGVFAVDAAVPPQFDVAILYVVPLVLLAMWSQSRGMVWGLLPVLLAFIAIGYLSGPSTPLSRSFARNAIENRILTGFGLMAVAFIVDSHLSRDHIFGTAPRLDRLGSPKLGYD